LILFLGFLGFIALFDFISWFIGFFFGEVLHIKQSCDIRGQRQEQALTPILVVLGILLPFLFMRIAILMQESVRACF